MGKTKIKTIDGASEADVKEPKKRLGRQDELVERLKAELETPSEKQAKPEPIEATSVPANTSDGGRAISEDSSEVRKIESKSPKPGKAKPRSKKYQGAIKDLDKSKTYPLNEAVELVKKVSYSKFTGTMEAHVNTAQTGIRGLVSLPFASGKKLRILVFADHTSKESKPTFEVDNVTFGDESTIEQINKGKVAFDLVVTTPQWMPKLAKVARILGPRGLMPSPKNGTITDDLKKAIEGFQAGKTEYKTESKANVIHLGLGKLDQPTEQLSANIKTLLQTLGKSRVKKVNLSPTMGPSVKLDLSSL